MSTAGLCDARHAAACRTHSLMTKLMAVTLICGISLTASVNGQIAYTGHLSDLRIRELENIANRMEHSVKNSFACDSFYDHVCSRNRPMYSVMGHLPEFDELIQLLTELQEDRVQFEAKQKLIDFFISCNTLKSLEQCYYESFEYFKPLFGYIITKNYINISAHEHELFASLLSKFINKTQTYSYNPVRRSLVVLREKFVNSHDHFSAVDLNREYAALRIYRDSYKHNVRNLEQHKKRNSTYESGVARTMLDWSLYLYQSRSKPMSYYYSTFSVHLWMSLFNNTERQRDSQYFHNVGECLKLPQFVNVLGEARILAVVYLKSFRNAWQDYMDWIKDKLSHNQYIYNHEEKILKPYGLDNKRLFFTLYGQNFCDFGKELAEHVFYLGLKDNPEFYTVYSCGYQSPPTNVCV